MMATIHIERIKNALHKLFDQHIDMADFVRRAPEQREQCFLSRALAAYSLFLLADIAPQDAGTAVTDGFDDGGIDALYFDRSEHVLFIVQSKWSNDGRSSIQQGECAKFLNGFRKLINLELDDFNDRVRGKTNDVRAALHDVDVHIALVIACSAISPLSDHTRRDINDLVTQENDPIELIQLEVIDQAQLYAGVTGETLRPTINEQLMLREWGAIVDPYIGYYGQVDAPELAELWKKHGPLLLARNIRHFRGSTDVNLAVEVTLRRYPERFWYLNNGITIVCDSVEKLPIGASSRESGVFDCRGLSVVNGAQTVGVIGRLAERLESALEAKVLVRLLSLADCPQGFDKVVARATNTQNRIGSRDFAALDPNQQRLASELLLDGLTYAYKTGEEVPPGPKGCSIVEATVALACAEDDVSLAVQAKREIGRLWENIESEPYTLLFNDRTGAVELWRAVEVLRRVDGELKSLELQPGPRAELTAVHGNRLIVHRVFQDPRIRKFRSVNAEEFWVIMRLVPEVTRSVFQRLTAYLDREYRWAYLGSLFKNLSKCRDVDSFLQRSELDEAHAPSKSVRESTAPTDFREELF